MHIDHIDHIDHVDHIDHHTCTCTSTCTCEVSRHRNTQPRNSSMWGLDRITANSTPSGTPPMRSDSYSPAPRRPYPASGPGSLPPRPGLTPRSSSLNLLSPGASTTSLSSTARIPNGARRQPSVRGRAPPNVADPLRVLESILGGPPRRPIKREGDVGTIPAKPDEVVQDIDFGGLSLHEFATAEAPRRRREDSVNTYREQSVEECTSLCHIHSPTCEACS